VLLGGTSGIGLAAAELLASVGARVLLVGRDKDRLQAAVTRVQAAATRTNPAGTPAPTPAGTSAATPDGTPGATPDATFAGTPAGTSAGRTSGGAGGAGVGADVHGISADVTDDDALAEVFDWAGTVDHVLMTAGRPAGIGPVTELTRDTAQAAVAGPVAAVFGLVRAAVPRLNPGGSITLTSGILVARPQPGMSAPVSAAGAMETAARALAVELAPARLRGNAIRFGAIDTPLLRSRFGATGAEADAVMAEAGAATPLGRFGTAEEAASAALFLMANPYMSGEVLTVDGGQSLA
jgi:NAD(P)-dependent dehydrogenase (short-subunit alcohol dehydrogenase family)